jgi:hypothetical protein
LTTMILPIIGSGRMRTAREPPGDALNRG